ncbi:hypothetical protein FJV41_37065, partial [Myxococcus llanfairpwllgwyngyllgogerychwyrndrobwllllantysiliogogogochensis]
MPRLSLAGLPLRHPVLSRKSLLPLLAVVLWSLVPGSVQAQVNGGAPSAAPVPSTPAPASERPQD